MAFTFGYTNYTSDTTAVWSIKMRSDMATALGLTLSALPANAKWPYRNRDLRHIRVKNNGTGKPSRLVAVTLATAFYNASIGTSVTAPTGASTKISTFGEKRPLNG